ncbi:MAG: general secretion pathway protein G [Mariniblastus sp.]|jgi:general secretion pathway protein G
MRINRKRKSGFTLLELLLVMAILVVLASLSTFAVLSLKRGALAKAAVTEISTLSNACKMYKLQVGSFPAKLEDLHQAPSGMDRNTWGGPYLDKPVNADPWQRPYKFGVDEANDLVMISSDGPDGQSGTQDDIPDPARQNQ